MGEPAPEQPPAASPAKAFSIFKKKDPATAAAPAAQPTALDMFASRHNRPTEEDQGAKLSNLKSVAAEALAKTVNLEVNAATPSASTSAVAPEPEVIPVWDKKYGPYDDPNLLLVDILRQLAKEAFEMGILDPKAKFAGMSYTKGASNIHSWPKPVLDGKKAAKEIDGVGKGTADKIDKILKDKFYRTSDGKTFYPLGNVLPKAEEDAMKDEAKQAKEAEKEAAKAEKKAAREAAKAERDANKPPTKKRKKSTTAEAGSDSETVKAESASPAEVKVKDEKPKIKEEPILIDDDDEDVKPVVKSPHFKEDKKAPAPAPKKVLPAKKPKAKPAPKKGKKKRMDSDDDDSEESEASFSEDESAEESEEAASTPDEDSDDSDAPKKKRKLIRKK